MQNIDWRWYQWSELTNDTLYELMRLRQQVFIVEQQCLFNDADGLDRYCRHLIGWQNSGSQVVAALRIVPPLMAFDSVSVGRVVTSQSVRGLGVGRHLMSQGLQWLDHHGVQLNTISAQHHLQPFYASFGYQAIGQTYQEDGITHIDMQRQVSPPTVGDQSKRLYFSPLVAEHAPALFTALNHDAVYQFMDEERYPNVQGLAARYARLKLGAPVGSAQIWLNWVITLQGSHKAIGTVQATLYPNAQADIGYALDPADWQQGYGTEAVAWLCQVLTQRYGMQRIRAQVDSRNTASFALLERLGFERQVSISSELHGLPSLDYVYGLNKD